jgi:hypothetical protein
VRKLGEFDIGVDCFAPYLEKVLALGFEGDLTRIYIATKDLEYFIAELRGFGALVDPEYAAPRAANGIGRFDPRQYSALLAAAQAVAYSHDQGEACALEAEALANAVDAIIGEDDAPAERVTIPHAEVMALDLRAGAVLPADSAARKAIPLCTGVVDYFPAVIVELVAQLRGDGKVLLFNDFDLSPDQILIALANRDTEEYAATLVFNALDLLEAELRGSDPTEFEVHTRWPRALVEVARISKAGNDKHNPGQPLHHARGKSMDHADTIARHLLERGGFDGEMRHSACLAWRCMALRQEQLEAQGAPLARGAQLPEAGKSGTTS